MYPDQSGKKNLTAGSDKKRTRLGAGEVTKEDPRPIPWGCAWEACPSNIRGTLPGVGQAGEPVRREKKKNWKKTALKVRKKASGEKFDGGEKGSQGERSCWGEALGGRDTAGPAKKQNNGREK